MLGLCESPLTFGRKMNHKPFTEFSEYPELKDNQKSVLQSIGLALFGVQGVESKLQFLLSFVFPANADASFRDLYSEDQKAKKETLGRLIHNLKKQSEVAEDFQEQLSTFLTLRNRFVHGLFAEKGYSLGSDEDIQRVQDFISDLEFHAWMIDAVLMGYVIAFAKALGMDAPEDSITERNRHKYFSPVINFKE